MKILLKKATIIDPQSPFHHAQKDLLIDQGSIVSIQDNITDATAKKISFPNLHVSRGWLDTSVSFGEPGFEERETLDNGLRTAGKSGFTNIMLNSVTAPLLDNASTVGHLVSYSANYATQIHPIACFSQGQKGEKLNEFYDLKKHGAVAFGDFQLPIVQPELLKTALLYSQGVSGIIMSYPFTAQMGQPTGIHEGLVSTQLGLRGEPDLFESLQVQRDLAILEYTGGKLHLPSLSAKKSVAMVRAAKKKGLDVSCSVALANLLFTEDQLMDFDHRYKLTPPLRTSEDREALKEGVLDGTIDMITSNHLPLNEEIKALDFQISAPGTTGLEAFFGVLNTLFPPEKTIQLLLKGYERFGLDNPSIEEGNKAQLSLFNPDGDGVFEEHNILSTSKNSAFVGAATRGNVYGVIRENHHQFNGFE